MVQLHGWLLWAGLSSLCAVAGQRWAARVLAGRGAAERFSLGLLASLSIVVLSVQLPGALKALRPVPVALVSVGLSAALLAASRRKTRLPLSEESTEPLARPWGDLAEPLLGAIPLALVVLGASAAQVWIFKSWNWDATAYHLPIINHALETGALEPVTSPMGLFVGFPRNGELIGVWNCLFSRDNRLDDAQQLPFCVLGWSLVAAWVRHLGGPRPVAAGVGAAFLLIPAVFLQAAHAQVDIACAVLLTGAVYFATRSLKPVDWTAACLCLGLYLGTKFSGAFHLALLTPLLLARGALGLRRHRTLKAGLGMVASGLLIPLLGAWQYVQNLRAHGNPVFPFNLHLLGLRFPGLYDAGPFYGAPVGTTGAFFGAPGDLLHLAKSLYTFDSASLFPDVRTGGFGIAFAYALLPLLVLWSGRMLWKRRWGQCLPVLLLCGLGFAVPAAHWARFSLAAAMASLVAFGALVGGLKSRKIARFLSTATLCLFAGGLGWSLQSLWRHRFHYGWPLHLVAAWHAPPEERATLQLTTWLWPKPWAEQREAELKPGSVVAYDESQDFLSEYSTRDYRSQVVFVSSLDDQSYVGRLRAAGARWAGVRDGSAAEAALKKWGAERLFRAPRTNTQLYRLPRQ